MTKSDQIKILNNKIKASIAQYDINRLNAEISAYSEGDLDKYEFLTRKDLKYKPNALDKAKFDFSPLCKAFLLLLLFVIISAYQRNAIQTYLFKLLDKLIRLEFVEDS